MAAISSSDPANERARLEALRRYAILDTPPEREFDELVRRAAHECGYPTALITLMETERCWFKATTGLLPVDENLRELPREQTLCNYAFRSSGVLVVPDARDDERFRRLSIIDRPESYRAYVGAQLITPDGYSIGSVCLLDTEPRTPTPRQLETLRIIATRVMALIESRHSDLAPAPAVTFAPIRSAPSSARPALPSTTTATGPRDIAVIVDDEDLIRGVTAAMVGRLGCETRLATNGKEALDRITSLGGRVRLVITDINMPVMDGVELVRSLRRLPDAPAIAVMSGRFTHENRRQLREEGVTHFISKPFGMPEIEHAVRSLLTTTR